jgi:hypothetical protein
MEVPSILLCLYKNRSYAMRTIFGQALFILSVGCSSDEGTSQTSKKRQEIQSSNELERIEKDNVLDQDFTKEPSSFTLKKSDVKNKEKEEDGDIKPSTSVNIDESEETKKKTDLEVSSDKKTEDAKKISKSSVDMGDMELFTNLELRFSGVSLVFRNYFYDQNAQNSYFTFLRREAAASKLDVKNLPVYIRWDDMEHNMGKGEICVYSSDPLPQDHIKSYSRAIYAYRTYLGSYFDVRLMSFSMCIESSTCRFEVLDRSDISGIASCVMTLSDEQSGSLRPVNTLAVGQKKCTSSSEIEQRSKTPITYDSLEEQFEELWPQVEGCFVD